MLWDILLTMKSIVGKIIQYVLIVVLANKRTIMMTNHTGNIKYNSDAYIQIMNKEAMYNNHVLIYCNFGFMIFYDGKNELKIRDNYYSAHENTWKEKCWERMKYFINKRVGNV
jgi:hypothetical protein